MSPEPENSIETNDFTLTFTGEQFRILSDIAHMVVVDKIARWDDLEINQQLGLVEARNLMQKRLNFPNLKF